MNEPAFLGVEDFIGPAGNATPKYDSRNPLTRTLLARFLEELERASELSRPTTLLDVGCGEGIVTERLARLTGASTVGVDLGDPKLQEEWRQRAGDGISFRAASAYGLPFENDAFDLVCAIEVLEHLERPEDALAELVRVARGHVLVSVPREPWWRIAHVLAGRNLRRLGNTPGHLQHWTAHSFAELVSRYGHVTSLRRPFPWIVAVLEPRAGATTSSERPGALSSAS